MRTPPKALATVSAGELKRTRRLRGCSQRTRKLRGTRAAPVAILLSPKNGTRYASVRVDGEQYPCRDDALISKLESGQDVDYQWERSGKFKKIIDIEPVLDDLELSPKDLRILRMSALRSASYLEIGLDAPLEEKLRTTLET